MQVQQANRKHAGVFSPVPCQVKGLTLQQPLISLRQEMNFTVFSLLGESSSGDLAPSAAFSRLLPAFHRCPMSPGICTQATLLRAAVGGQVGACWRQQDPFHIAALHLQGNACHHYFCLLQGLAASGHGHWLPALLLACLCNSPLALQQLAGNSPLALQQLAGATGKR